MTADDHEPLDPADEATDPAADEPFDTSPRSSGTTQDRFAGDTAPAEDGTEEVDEPAEPTVEQQLAERTADLQRVHAEYQNYRKRVERDRALARTQGGTAVLKSLLTVLDDIGRAEQHGELEGGFKAVADQLLQVVAAQGLESYGAEGDEFDPRLHEALFQAGESSEITTTTVATVVRTGYRVGEEILRDAQVGVLAPAGAEPEQQEVSSQDEAGTDEG